MKKLLAILLVGLHFSAFAQLEDALDKTQQNQRSDGHKKGDLFVMAGLGLGAHYVDQLVLPPLMLNVEYGFHDMLSVGVMGGFGTGRSKEYETVTGKYHWRYNYVSLAGRASFHWGRYINIPDELDLYGRVALGWRLRTEKWVDTDSGINEPDASSDFGLIAGIHAGAKYMLTPTIGAYLEVGHDNVSNVQVGAAFKF